MDAIVIANECVDVRQISKVLGILCKMDREKAYDHLNWGFLWKNLENMGFGERWINWIKSCTSIVKFSVLINDSPTSFFSSERGLRQRGSIISFSLYLGNGGSE